jgi:predicted branched-subunit amino acid permease
LFSAATAAEIRQERIGAFNQGLRHSVSALIANAAWATVTGIAMVKSGMPEMVAVAVTVLVYAGSAQLTALPLLAAGSPLWLVFLACAVVNLRFVIFNAALYPHFRDRPWWYRLLVGFYTSDFGFALFMMRHGQEAGPATRAQRWYYLGLIIPGWATWQVFSMAGIFLGAFIPASWSLDFAATLALMSLVLPLVASRPMLAAAVAAAVVAWLGQTLPLRLGLLGAVVAGILAGIAAERRLSRRAAIR